MYFERVTFPPSKIGPFQIKKLFFKFIYFNQLHDDKIIGSSSLKFKLMTTVFKLQMLTNQNLNQIIKINTVYQHQKFKKQSFKFVSEIQVMYVIKVIHKSFLKYHTVSLISFLFWKFMNHQKRKTKNNHRFNIKQYYTIIFVVDSNHTLFFHFQTIFLHQPSKLQKLYISHQYNNNQSAQWTKLLQLLIIIKTTKQNFQNKYLKNQHTVFVRITTSFRTS
eukprot:TRINITY_DN9438_c0_g3_i2.p1 TRINITY_DN9438_c0_g3~~TRINITY_DN9438_c0_g3_i2.p1  ORF type:complete len:220 (+),score=-21.98 TRINITY_DN9438_c0_g3_i2:346-1005(+)